MRQFELSSQEEINIYINSGLTPTELFILRLLFLAADGDDAMLKNYISNIVNGRELLISVLQSLKDKKVILASYEIPIGKTFKASDIPFNKNFLKMYIKESNEIGKEFFDAYPPFININGRMCSIKNFTKAGLYSIEEFCTFYAKTIKNAKVTHERVMSALEFGKENNLINCSCLEFIASHKWEEIEYIRDSGDINGYSNSELI